MPEGYADLGTIKLHYVQEGEGDLALLLHGFPDYCASWKAQLPALAEAGFRAVAPDLRGYNLSDKPKGVGAYDIDLLVEDVRNLIDALDAPRAHLVGHDWGGVISWYFAMRYPEYLDRLAILNSPHPAHVPMGWLRDPRQLLKSWYVFFFQIPSVPEHRLADDDFRNLKRVYFGQKGAFEADEIEEYIEAARRTGNMSGPLNYYRAFLRSNPIRIRSRRRRIDGPVLVLWGDGDAALQPSLAEPPQELVPNAEVVHFPDAGHWVHKQKPDEINKLLRGFLTAGEKDFGGRV